MSIIIDDNILIRFIAGEISDDNLIHQIDEWINECEENKSHYNSLIALWQASERDEYEIDKLKEKIWTSIERRAEGQQKNVVQLQQKISWKKAISIAASIAIVLSTSIYFILKQIPDDNYHTFYADAGSKSKISLSDGTTVYLNSETELKIPNDFGKDNRNVELIGEAFFEVQKTENKSLFNVKVGELNIKVLGTEFNVKGYPNEGTIETTLEKGKVEIEKQTTGKLQKIIALEPNQQAVFVKKKGEILVSNVKEETLGGRVTKNNPSANHDEERKEKLILKEQIETKLYTSWKEGEFVFESETFNNLIVRMQRWYGIKIELKNDSLKNIEFTGRLKNETIEQALNALKMSQTFEYKMDIKNNVVYIK